MEFICFPFLIVHLVKSNDIYICRNAIQQEIEQVKLDIRRIDRPEDYEEEGPKKKKAKMSYVGMERQRFLSSGKAVVAKRKKGNESDVSK